MLPFDNVYIKFALTISVIQGYIHKLSPVIKGAKNSITFTSFFY